MSSVFDFGEQLDGYSVRVLNERAVRAGAGLLFAFAIVSFMNAWLAGNFQLTRVFIVAFLVLLFFESAFGICLGCKVPEFAKAMGHEEKWKLHNNCR